MSAGDADVVEVAAVIGDRSRARVLMALGDGRALPASVLAAEAGVSASTVSEHLGRLRAAGLVVSEKQGRHQYYRLSGPQVGRALEALAALARPAPVRSLRQGTHAQALRSARTCYDHLAGRLGVAVMRGLLDRGLLVGGDGRHHPEREGEDRLSAPGHDVDYRLTRRGTEVLGRLGVDLGRASARYCLDWSEQQHHLAGPLGRALAARLFELDWVRRGSRRRVIVLTDDGREGLTDAFGVAV